MTPTEEVSAAVKLATQVREMMRENRTLHDRSRSSHVRALRWKEAALELLEATKGYDTLPETPDGWKARVSMARTRLGILRQDEAGDYTPNP